MNKKALFSISSLGLGHATRTIPVIKYYLQKGYSLDIVSFGNALNYLKNEFKDSDITFYELQDYPPLERGSGISFYLYLVNDTIKTHFLIQKEHSFLQDLESKNNYNFIFSDGRYGFFSKKTKSYILSHQLSFDMPKGFGWLQKVVDRYNKKIFQKFDRLFIADYEDENNNLAGKLSHPKWINEVRHRYIGILSSLYDIDKKEKKQDIDYFFTISGYLQEHKDTFVGKLMSECKNIVGKKVFMLGDTKKFYKLGDENSDFVAYSFLSGKEKNDIFQKSDVIVSRAGYTTIMDVVELGKKSILFPTPNQTEQEYLAIYLKTYNYFVIGNETHTLQELAKKLDTLATYHFPTKTKEALEIIDLEVNKK